MKAPRITRRRVLLSFLLLTGATATYFALLIFPDAFFAYKLRRGHVVIRSDAPIPASAAAVLD
jgi:hypothetical protein